MSQIITLGAHHHGPHVDWLLALAERCGAQVVRVPHADEPVDADALCELATVPVKVTRRVPYAGKPTFCGGEVRP
ncbi:hypothetical protein [uncultured Devosia sp.]|uniref:hypothetical protein n=1 Tax=uncultured Devosia sp. TaxID=211434 RepID=UPI00262CE774|nr:hypothetical protein [uncultured Devosia sp.]